MSEELEKKIAKLEEYVAVLSDALKEYKEAAKIIEDYESGNKESGWEDFDVRIKNINSSEIELDITCFSLKHEYRICSKLYGMVKFYNSNSYDYTTTSDRYFVDQNFEVFYITNIKTKFEACWNQLQVTYGYKNIFIQRKRI